MSIPLGEILETFIKWLKSVAGGVFDWISGVLDFAISMLENVLMLDHSKGYPSVVWAGLIGLFVFLILKPRKGTRIAGIAAAACALVFGGVELWRNGQLSQQASEENLTAMIAQMGDLQQSIEAVAPETYDRALEALAPMAAPVEALEGEAGEEAQDTLADTRRDFERLRDNRFERAAGYLEDFREDMAEVGLSSSELEAVEAAEAFYLSFALADESERLARRFERVDEPTPRNLVLNERTYSNYLEQLEIARRSFLAEGEDALAEQLNEVKASLSPFNPQRLSFYPWAIVVTFLAALAWVVANRGIAVFTLLGFLLIVSMGYWEPTVQTLALVLSATVFALIIGVPLGIGSAKSEAIDNLVKPVLDFMQTMPAFVYLIPAVMFFGLGKVPGAMATLIFAMPPAVRLTALGIRQVPTEVVEAAEAFGATGQQQLFKAELPIALPTILAGLNQTIMLSLSMVVIGGMIGAGGLGEIVLMGITQVKIGLGFESGLSVVILAIFLDRLTQALGHK